MKKKVTPAAFSLNNFKFTSFSFDYNLAPQGENLNVDFVPSGIFSVKKKRYELKIDFFAFDENKSKNDAFIKVSLSAFFKFRDVASVEEIPNFFYKNSIAIVYPYIRAFVSNISLQSNSGTLILPTLNLSSLEDDLIKNTTTV